MRLIDADALIKNIEGNRNCSDMPSQWIEGVNYAIDLIEIYEPTVDAVEVVRCRECKHSKCREYARDGFLCFCNKNLEYWQLNDFCSYGEREGER